MSPSITRDQLRTDKDFTEWVNHGRKMGFLFSLGELVDTEVGGAGFPNSQPHLSNINLGVQIAVRQVRGILRDPLAAAVTQKTPPPNYGVLPGQGED